MKPGGRTMRRAVLVALVLGDAEAGDARAAAPAGRYTVTSDIVTDNVTHLVWESAASTTTQTWSDAATYCQGRTTGGLSGWRLPTIRELLSIVDPRACSQSIDTTVFPNTPSSAFWSSTLISGDSSYAWGVNFDGGGMGAHNVGGYSYVRCVR